MSNLPSVQSTPSYMSPKEKGIRTGVKYALWAVIALPLLAIFGKMVIVTGSITLTVFTIINQILALGTLTLVHGAILAVLVVLMWQTFSSHGLINKIIRMVYESVCQNLTRQFVAYDPVTPLEKLEEERQLADRDFDQAVGAFQGVVQNLTEKRDDYLGRATKAHKDGAAAYQRVSSNNDPDGTFQSALEEASQNEQAFKETASDFQTNIGKLTPILATLKELSSANKMVIRALHRDIGIMKDKWEAAKDMEGAQKAGNTILSGSARDQLAQMAQEIITTRYAAQIGQLNALRDRAKPILDAQRLGKAVALDSMIADFQQESRQAITSIQTVTAVPVLAGSPGAPYQALPVPAGNGSGFSGLIG